MNFIIFDVFQNEVGGVNYWVDVMISELETKGHSVKRISFYGENNDEKKIYLNTGNRKLRVMDTLTIMSFSQRKFNKIIDTFINSDTRYHIITVYPLLSRFILNSKLNDSKNINILQYHNDKKILFETKSVSSFSHRYLLKKYIPKFDYFSTFTDQELKYMESLGFNNNIIIRNGIKQINTNNGLSKKILFISRLTKEKRCPEVLDIFISISDELRKNGFSVNLYIAHNENFKTEAKQYNLMNEKIIKSRNSDVINLSKGIYGNEKEEAFNNSDIVVNYSDFEGLPMVLLESLSHYSIPVFRRSTENLFDLINQGENGFIIENEDEMKEKLTLLINNTEIISQMKNNINNNIDKILASDIVDNLVNKLENVHK